MPTALIATLADVERETRIPLAERRLPASTYELLCRAAERHADRIALQFLPQGSPDEEPVVFRYGEWAAEVTRTANLFHRLGLGPDDAAAFILPNVPQTHLALWGGEAACRVGAVNPLLEQGQLTGILRAMEAKVLVTLGPDGSHQGFLGNIARLADRVPSLTGWRTKRPGPKRKRERWFSTLMKTVVVVFRHRSGGGSRRHRPLQGTAPCYAQAENRQYRDDKTDPR